MSNFTQTNGGSAVEFVVGGNHQILLRESPVACPSFADGRHLSPKPADDASERRLLQTPFISCVQFPISSDANQADV